MKHIIIITKYYLKNGSVSAEIKLRPEYDIIILIDDGTYKSIAAGKSRLKEYAIMGNQNRVGHGQ